MNQIQVFNKEEFGSIRVIEINGSPWFVGKDITDLLGYSNNSAALSRHVDKKCRMIAKVDTTSGEQNMVVINESGLYALILSSKMLKAKELREWIISDVVSTFHKNNHSKEKIMNNLQVFSHPSFGNIRTVELNGEPWFVGKDVAEVLGYSNPRDALGRHVDDEDKKTVVNPDGNRGNPNMTIINESGLYSLILSSKLPSAKEFKRWVTSEVLPRLRRNGFYVTNHTPDVSNLSAQTQILMQQAQMMMLQAQSIAELERKQNVQQKAIEETNKKIDDMQEIMILDHNEWRKATRSLVGKIAMKRGGYDMLSEINAEIYMLLESRAGVNLNLRLRHKQERMASEGIPQWKRDKVSKVDVIAEDKKLTEIFTAIVKEMAVKYGVEVA